MPDVGKVGQYSHKENHFLYSVTDQSLQTLPSKYLFPEATQKPRTLLLSLRASNATVCSEPQAHLNADAGWQGRAATVPSAVKHTEFQPTEAAEWFHLEEECVKATCPS